MSHFGSGVKCLSGDQMPHFGFDHVTSLIGYPGNVWEPDSLGCNCR